MKTKLKKLVRSAKCLVLSAALCAVGLSAFAEPDAVQLWEGGPYFATCNVGGTVPGDYGELYKFNDNKAADAAKGLGEGWRLPTDTELSGLLSNCDKNWETCKNSDGENIEGYRFTGKNTGYTDKSIFLPAAGVDYDNGDGRAAVGSEGYYWSSKEGDGGTACLLYFYDGYAVVFFDNRSNCMSVRAVRDTPPTPTPPEPSDEEVVATAEATFVLGPALAVANVTTATHWPWDGKIDVTCDLTGSGNVQLSAALTTNGVKVCDATAANITGATEIDLDQVGGVTNGVKFVWNAKADCPADFNSKDTKVKVSAKKVVPLGGVQLWEGGPIFAECNVGAEKPEEAGYYFWWGDTVGYKHDGSKWVSVDGKGATIEFRITDTTAKQSSNKNSQGIKDAGFSDDASTGVLNAAHDAATAHLGAPWRMPTYAELQGLVDECDRLAINTNGAEYKDDGDTFAGWRVMGRGAYSSNSIFLPMAGYGSVSSISSGYTAYWSSMPSPTSDVSAYCLKIMPKSFSIQWPQRYLGNFVRAVRDAK